jgi:pimeloyl-ACP methyl ester carboxylesterase
VVDTTAGGGAIDGPPGPPRTTLSVPAFTFGSEHFSFLLYRAPRNFDGATTGQLPSRTVTLSMIIDGRPPVPIKLTIVRPLVVFVHGTFANNDTWASLPLWQHSANELNGFQAPQTGALPFAADRVSFNWIWNATGGVQENAQTVLAQLVRAIRAWREATRTAGTQADVITHSFGGFVARQVVQTQPDPSPLAAESLRNFRSAENWGHGSIHKLIALAATHRGSAASNASAFLNENGVSRGTPRALACLGGEYIDKGAVRDQLVLSQALQALGQTRVPGHAVVGSGRALLDPSGFYAAEDKNAATLLDKQTGPYATAFGDPNCPYDAVANYTFNLNKDTPPFTGSGSTCNVVPNYDLVVSAYSSQGLQPPGATTTVQDLEASSGLSLVGLLNHSALLDPVFGSAAIVAAVSNRLVFLLQQPTTSTFFNYFPAVASVAPNPVEQQFSTYDPAWLEAGSQCPDPSYHSGCTAAYTNIAVVPSQLTLEDATPAPLYVYGLLNGQWVLVYSPTFIFATAPPINRNCPITLTSSDTSIVSFETNSVTGSSVPVAAGVGTATIQVSVQGFNGVIAPVPVTVTGVGALEGR